MVTLEGFVRDRVGRCSADASRLALALAVLAENTDAEIVAEVSGLEGQALAEAAADLGRVELLDELTGSAIREPLLAKAVVACSDGEDVVATRLAGARALWRVGEPERAGAQLAELESSPGSEPWRTEALLAAAEAASRGGSAEHRGGVPRQGACRRRRRRRRRSHGDPPAARSDPRHRS